VKGEKTRAIRMSSIMFTAARYRAWMVNESLSDGGSAKLFWPVHGSDMTISNFVPAPLDAGVPACDIRRVYYLSTTA
jgi:hypothetical protein